MQDIRQITTYAGAINLVLHEYFSIISALKGTVSEGPGNYTSSTEAASVVLKIVPALADYVCNAYCLQGSYGHVWGDYYWERVGGTSRSDAYSNLQAQCQHGSGPFVILPYGHLPANDHDMNVGEFFTERDCTANSPLIW